MFEISSVREKLTSDLEVFLCLSLMLCCLTDCQWSGWSPAAQDWNNSPLRMSVGAGQHPDSQHTATSSHHPKAVEGEEFNCRTTRPLGVYWKNWATGLYISLSLPLHVSLSLFHFVSLDPARATKLRLERGVGNKWRTLPDPLLFISQLLTVNTSSVSESLEKLH